MNEIKITELCLTENGNGIRKITYNTKFDTLYQALTDYETNYNFNNMVKSEDDFQEECIDSKIIGIEFIL